MVVRVGEGGGFEVVDGVGGTGVGWRGEGGIFGWGGKGGFVDIGVTGVGCGWKGKGWKRVECRGGFGSYWK